MPRTQHHTAVQAARGIYRVVTEAMANAARSHATDRGVDYRRLPLLRLRGAGALHACSVAELLQSSSVIVRRSRACFRLSER